MSQINLSVIIVNWNTCRLLRNCLASLVNNPVSNREIIVVDNDSTDGSREMIQTDFSQVRLIANAANKGFAVANNQALAVAQGQYCLLLNSDTIVEPDALNQLITFMNTHPEAGACGPQLLNEDRSLQPSGRALPTFGRAIAGMLPLPPSVRNKMTHPLEKRDYTQIATVEEVSGAALFLRKDALAQTGFLDERFFFFGEDVDLCWRLRKANWQIYYVPQAKIIHLWGGSRKRLSEKMSLLAQRATVLLFQKHGSPMQAIGLKLVVFFLTLGKLVYRKIKPLDSTLTWSDYWQELLWLINL